MSDRATLGQAGWDITNPIFEDGIPTDWRYAAATGLIPNASRIATLGTNPSVDTSTQPEDVWAGAELATLNGIDHKYIPKPTAAVSMEVVSSSVNDAAAGTGARTVVVGYLDASYNAKTAVIALNGTTPVPMPENVLRINSLIVATAGAPTAAGTNNAGNISVRATGGAGAIYAYMAAGFGIARSSLYTVPAGNSLDILSMFCSINRTDTNARFASFAFCIQNAAGRLIKGLEFSCGSESPYRHEADGSVINTIAEKTDVWLRCESVNLSSTNVTGSLFGIQRKNPALAG